jgi:hypothetical protein
MLYCSEIVGGSKFSGKWMNDAPNTSSLTLQLPSSIPKGGL